jgi:hypothetical protein
MIARPNAALAQIHTQIMWNRLVAVVEEQAQTMIRTAFSTSVREAGDLSAGVFDRQGRMLAQAVTGTPGHVNSMANGVRHFLDVYPIASMKPGDHYITNDPSSRRAFIAAKRSGCLPTPSMWSISAGLAWDRTAGRCSRRASPSRS